MMIGVCECPMAIITPLKWAEQVEDNASPLRDIIDLDLTYMKLNGVSVEDNSVLGGVVAGGLVASADDDSDSEDENEDEDDTENDAISENEDWMTTINMISTCQCLQRKKLLMKMCSDR